MLFDLRGRGRRNTIKVIYGFLALLMGGSLVLLGFGGSGGGGLLDAITGNGSSSGDTGSARYEKQETAALATLKTNPKSTVAYERLITARVQLAALGDNYDTASETYTESGKAELREATQAWDAYQKLDPPPTQEQGDVANRIVGAYLALNQEQKLVEAQEIFAEIRNATGPYQNLAAIAYQLGQTRKGELAAQKAVELAPESERATVKSDMDDLKAQSAAATPSAVPSPTASATASPEASATATATPKRKRSQDPDEK